MTILCSITGCDRPTHCLGMCSMHYQRDYAVRKRRGKKPEEKAVVQEPPVEPAITEKMIDAMPDWQLDQLVMQEIYGEVYGCVPANHPRAEAFLQAHPEIRRERRTDWFWPDMKPGYAWHFWHPDRPTEEMHDAWLLIQTMLARPRGEVFEAMLLDGKFHRLDWTMRQSGQKNATRFITRCALKAFLLSSAS